MYVVRHGEAGTPLEDQRMGADLLRPLSAEGRQQIGALGKYLKDNDIIPSKIYHSPATRTRQTAQIIGKATGAKLIPDDTLQWGNSVRGRIKQCCDDKSEKRVMVVSHHDCIRNGLRALNFMDGGRVDPIAKGELRSYDVDRKTYTWEEDMDARVLPSSLNDEYSDEYL